MWKRFAHWLRRRRNPRIAIYGQYKTGTTGFFYLIRNSLEKSPIELFERPSCYPLPDDHLRPILAKVMVPAGSSSTQDYNEREAGLRTFRSFDRQIYLLRDPRDWLVSGVMYFTQAYPPFYSNPHAVESLLGLLRRKQRNPGSVAMLDLLATILDAGGVLVDDWLPQFLRNHYDSLFRFEDGLGAHLQYRYEDFVAGRHAAVERYLGFPLNGTSMPDQVHMHVVRTRAAGQWRRWLTARDVERAEPLLMPYIFRHGYDPDWTLQQVDSLTPEHGSRYVRRVIEARLHSEAKSAENR